MSRIKGLLGLGLVATAALPLSAVYAADADNDTLEEIIVTAQNRVENVQKVPISIQVVGSEKLAESGFTGLNDISKIAPSVQVINDNNQMRVTVRGVGSNTNNETDDTSVVVNIDGEYINRPTVLGSSMFDIERIEVLKGPQGTLEGRNSTGGALNVITRKPGDKAKINATVGFGNYGSSTMEAGIDLPLSSIAAVRVAGIYNDHDGYYSHPANVNFITGGELTPAAKSGSERNKAGRFSLRLDPTNALKINLATEFADRHYVNVAGDTESLSSGVNAPTGPGCNAPGFVNIAPLWATGANPIYACVPMNTNFLAGKDRKAAFAQPWAGVGGYDFYSHATRASFEYRFGPAATLTYVGGYRSSNQTGSQGLPVTYKAVSFKDETRTQSHELRLSGEVGKVKYQGGLFHFDEKLNSDGGFAIDLFPFVAPAPGQTRAFLSYFTRDQDSKSDSAFGQVDIAMTDQLAAQVGVRYTKDKRTGLYGNAPAPLFAVGVFGTDHQDLLALFGPASQSVLGSEESKTTYLVGLNYTPNDTTFVYGKVSTGFKAGGFDQTKKQFSPESNTAIEVGLKKNFGEGGRHYFNASAFHYSYKDLQVSAFLNPAVGGQTFNAGKATIYGLDLDSGFRLTSVDSLTASVNYLHARFDEFLGTYDVFCVPASCTSGTTAITDLDPNTPGTQAPNLAGNTPANSPAVVATLAYDHTFRMVNGSTVKASLFARYKSSYYTDFYDYNDARQEAYAQGDVNVEYKTPGGHWSVQGYVQNVTDYRPLLNAYYIAAGPVDRIFNFWYGQPRTYGLKLGVSY